MSESEYIQQELFSGLAVSPAEAPLDESSLATVLDMLAVIDSLEELALLETLTDAQKRQVWDATPEPIKLRLRQLRAAVESASGSLHERMPDHASYEAADRHHSDRLPIAVGDRVILKAKPKLTSAELIAIWTVTAVEEDYARIKDEQLGIRLYPRDWLLIYPQRSDVDLPEVPDTDF
jgi:hypothetical protein